MKRSLIILVLTITSLAGRVQAYNGELACHADAGSDREICLGDKTTLGGNLVAYGGTAPYTYLWSPATGLDDVTIASPVANPKVTTTYTLEVTDATGCTSTSTVTVTIHDPPDAKAGKDKNICLGEVVQIGGTPAATGGVPPYSYQWFPSVGLDNSKVPNPNASPSVSTFYFLLVEDSFGCQNLDMVWVNVDEPSKVSAGSDQDACIMDSEIQLNGSITALVPTAEWSTSGTGKFSPSKDDLLANYLPSEDDKATGTVTLTLTSTGNFACDPTSDEMTITFIPETQILAGNDTTICYATPALDLNGSITGSTTTGYWTTTGTGVFTPDSTDLSATYIPSQADLDNGSVLISLNSTNTYLCEEGSNQFTITYKPLTADAGSDLAVCRNNPDFDLAGNATGLVQSVAWSTIGSGTFSPNNATSSPTYIPSATDLEQDSITLTYTVYGLCDTVQDKIFITFSDAPDVNAGGDQVICNGDSVILSGVITGPLSTFTWSANGAGTFDNTNELETVYYPATSDYQNGRVDITLSADGPDNCKVVEDVVKISFTDPLTVQMSDKVNICPGEDSVKLSPAVNGIYEDAKWTSAGTGYFSPSDSTLDATYFLSEADKQNGGTTLELTVSNSCSSASTPTSILITPELTINAEVETLFCTSAASLPLTGSSSDSTAEVKWISSGMGTFSPNANSINTEYIPDLQDFENDSIVFILSATNSCTAVADTVKVSVEKPGSVNAGPDVMICPGDMVPLNGNYSGKESYQWVSNGDGTFLPDNKSLNAIYVPSQTDIEKDSVVLKLSSEEICGTISDKMVITFAKPVEVSAGEDQLVCPNSDSIAIEGEVSDNSMPTQWTTTGTGKFTMGSEVLSNYYEPGSEDIENGKVQLILSLITDFDCQITADTTTISFKQEVEVNAGNDIIANSKEIGLAGKITGGTATWSSEGTGYFNPDEKSANPTYIASDLDILKGEVKITLTSDSSCEEISDYLMIDFPPELTIPNAFTPDGDGINDTFLDGVNKIILNRWGQVLYQGTAGWDGTHNGSLVSQGTYYYKILENTLKNESETTGSVTVVRN